MLLSATSHVATATPARYIARLCRHFAHRLPVQFDDCHGRIQFDFGLCLLQADDRGLALRVDAPDGQALAKLKHIVGTHFERFAWRDQLNLEWQPA
ncbi:DUF2218 domain-containing protein [Zestomonas thermotolerans]|jgi:hypothetical protein|uniref:DUF2218 domain-containing protein n=1 Tax=Zestomonas thermotolerans TaxID=157784 RepID=UPI000481757A|nr:DUF2218 domain-containing protein [Pseudomonas thermotolerans]